MTNPHTAVAIAQIVFYAPMLPLALFIFRRNWNNWPRLTWYSLIPFTLLRFTGGILTTVLESNPDNVGLIIAVTIMLNVGLVPLVIAAVGLIRLVLKSSADPNRRAHFLLRLIRVAFVIAMGLLIASGVLEGFDATISTSRALGQAGYVIFAVIISLLVLELAYLHTQKERLSPGSLIYVRLTLSAMPTLALRAAYGLLYMFTEAEAHPEWNPLYGSAIAFALLCLLPEYITALFYVYLGVHRIYNKI